MRRPPDRVMYGQFERPTLDLLLRFDRHTEARYESEHGAARAAELRHTIIFGVILYLLHDVSTYLLLPEDYWLIVVMTFFVVVPSSLTIAYLVAKVSSEVREVMVLGAILGATLLPVFMLYYSDAPHSTHMNVEVILCIVFANMLMALRFRYALVYTGAILFLGVLAVAMKSGVDLELKIAICFQFSSVCLLGVYSNYLFERRRCTDYCVSREATIRAETAEISEKQFQEISRTDALTGLPNRRFLDEQFQEWFADTRPAVVMMIDIDHFKLFNDTLGHPAGDECLRTIADAFKAAFSGSDVFCARFGGEEFILALRDAEELQARRLAHGVVRSIEALGIPHPGRIDGVDVVTVSIGVAFKPPAEQVSQEEVLSDADKALYQAKRNGRNCYVTSTEVADPRIMVNL